MAEKLQKPKGADDNFYCASCGCMTLAAGKCVNDMCPSNNSLAVEDDDTFSTVDYHPGHA